MGGLYLSFTLTSRFLYSTNHCLYPDLSQETESTFPGKCCDTRPLRSVDCHSRRISSFRTFLVSTIVTGVLNINVYVEF